MRWFLLLVAFTAVTTVGCKRNKSVESDGDLVASTQQTEEADAPRSIEDMSAEEIREMIEEAANVPLNPNFFNIPEPNTSGWEQSRTSNPTSEIVAFGRQVDRSLTELDRAYAQVRMFYDMGGTEAGRLTGFGEVRIDQGNRFNIEYYMPATNESLHRVVSDGRRRVENIGGDWRPLPPIEESKPLTREDLARFPLDFPQLMFSHARTGSNVYEPLFRAWSNGEFGAKPRIEHKTVEYEGRQLELVRVHTTLTTPYSAQVEITFDKNRNVPIKIRSIKEEQDGSKTHIVWDSQWAFTGGDHPQQKFHIPSTVARQ